VAAECQGSYAMSMRRLRDVHALRPLHHDHDDSSRPVG
jgi:hypothetical protein